MLQCECFCIHTKCIFVSVYVAQILCAGDFSLWVYSDYRVDTYFSPGRNFSQLVSPVTNLFVVSYYVYRRAGTNNPNHPDTH